MVCTEKRIPNTTVQKFRNSSRLDVLFGSINPIEINRTKSIFVIKEQNFLSDEMSLLQPVWTVQELWNGSYSETLQIPKETGVAALHRSCKDRGQKF